MQLILIQDVPHLGSLGDQVTVKDGYARNYLLPRGLALMASTKNARQIDHKRKRLEVLRQEAIVVARKKRARYPRCNSRCGPKPAPADACSAR